MSYIDNLRNSIKKLIQSEYKLNNYIPVSRQNKKIDDNADKKEPVNYDLIKLNNQITRMAKKKEYKNSRKILNVNEQPESSQNITVNNSPMDLSIKDDLYNVIDDDKQYTDWKHVDIDMKKKKVEEYISEISKQNGVDIPEDIKKEIFKMLDENKILYKKDINFDKINMKIINLFGLTFNNGEYGFSVVPVKLKKKNLINSMIKKMS